MKKTYQNRVVNQFNKIFFKIIFRRCTLTSVDVDVVFQPWWLIKQ